MTEPTHLVASRQGLFFVAAQGFSMVRPGRFFGIAIKAGWLYAFEALDPTRDRTNRGRIVRLELIDGNVGEPETLVDGLDNACHQLEFFGDELLVADTYNQRILAFDSQWQLRTHFPIPAAATNAWDDGYAHLNSLTAIDDRLLVLLHNGGEQPSELLQLNEQLSLISRVPIPGAGCHDIGQLQDGRLVFCNSPDGEIIDLNGPVARVDRLWTRGLAVQPDSITVGSSLFGHTAHRDLIPGFVTFFTPDFERIGRVHLPGAPTQIRSLARGEAA